MIDIDARIEQQVLQATIREQMYRSSGWSRPSRTPPSDASIMTGHDQLRTRLAKFIVAELCTQPQDPRRLTPMNTNQLEWTGGLRGSQ